MCSEEDRIRLYFIRAVYFIIYSLQITEPRLCHLRLTQMSHQGVFSEE